VRLGKSPQIARAMRQPRRTAASGRRRRWLLRVGDGRSAEVGGQRLYGPLPTFSMGCGRKSTR